MTSRKGSLRSLRLCVLSLCAVVLSCCVGSGSAVPGKAAIAPWRFAVIGDNRPGTLFDYTQNIYAITYRIPNSQRITILNSGDLTRDGTVDQWNDFKSLSAPLGIDWSANDPPRYIAAIGNHDVGDAHWLANWVSNLPAQRNLTAYSDIPASPDGIYGSVRYANAIFVWLDYHDLTSAQETFIQDTLVRAKADPQVTWRFVLFHRPPVACGYRNDWLPGRIWHDRYFQPNGVDIVFVGDLHYYERTCPFRNGLASAEDATSVCDTANRGNTIRDTNGVIHLITGGGGAELYPVGSCGWLEKAVSTHEFTEIEISGRTLHARTWDTDTGVGSSPQPPLTTAFKLIDEFTIQKEPG